MIDYMCYYIHKGTTRHLLDSTKLAHMCITVKEHFHTDYYLKPGI